MLRDSGAGTDSDRKVTCEVEKFNRPGISETFSNFKALRRSNLRGWHSKIQFKWGKKASQNICFEEMNETCVVPNERIAQQPG